MRRRTIPPADLTSPECGAVPDGFCTFRIADRIRIIIQFDLPAGCRKHFIARPYPGLLPPGEGETLTVLRDTPTAGMVDAHKTT